jgi:hypothetical protein
MNARFAALLLAATVTVAGGACSKTAGSKAATRETVTPLLQQEADVLKRDGEKLDPNFGVKATWTVRGLDVQEQADNASQPFRGTVRFVINSQTQESTGVVEHNFERTFKYVYDAKMGKWLFQP